MRRIIALAAVLVAPASCSSGASPAADISTFDADLPISDGGGPGLDGRVNGDAGAAFGPGAWASRAAPAGGPRQENAVVALDGEIYLVGGFDDGGKILTSVEVYRPASDSWRRVADLPVAAHHVNAAAVGGKLVVLGFLTGAGFTADGRGFAYDPLRDTWTPRRPMPSGSERGAAAVAVIGRKVYLAGGERGPAVSDFSAYDVDGDSWTTLPAMPRPADHAAGGAIGKVVYVAGGRSGGLNGHTSRLDAYDTIVKTWSTRAAMPTSRAGGAGAVFDGRLFVFGGEGGGPVGGVFDQSESYDPQADRWFRLTRMKTARHGTGAAAVGDLIYVPGGATREGFFAVATHEAFDPRAAK